MEKKEVIELDRECSPVATLSRAVLCYLLQRGLPWERGSEKKTEYSPVSTLSRAVLCNRLLRGPSSVWVAGFVTCIRLSTD